MMLPIIEFYGLPGAGKSYVSNQLISGLKNCAVKAFDRNELVIRALAARNDGFLTNCLKQLPSHFWHRVVHEDYCLQEMLNFLSARIDLAKLIFTVLFEAQVNTDHIRSILGAISKTSVEYELITSKYFSLEHLLVADEWFCHRFHTLLGTCAIPATKELINRYLKAIPESTITVFVATPPDECLRRMEMRKRFPQYLELIDCSRRLDHLKVAYLNLFQMTEEMAHTKADRTRCIIVEGSKQESTDLVEKCQNILGEFGLA